MKTAWKLFTKYKYVILSLVFALLATWRLLHTGLMPTHDGEYHLIRFYEFDKILRSGTWYPRWAPDLNYSYGIPLFTYIYPLPNYVASFLHMFGTSFLDSVKVNMLLASLFGAIFFYLWTKRFWGSLGGLVSSVFYTFSPYHFVDIYVRGSVGEVWALGIFPGFLWAYTEFVSTKKISYGILAALFLSLTIFAHNILGLMFFVFAISYIGLLILQNKQKRLLTISSFFILILSLGITSIFWLPALTETTYVTGLQIYNIQQNFTDVFQLLFPSWGTGFFGSNLGDQMSVQIGIANLLAISTVIVGLIFWRKKMQHKLLIAFSLTWFVVLFYLMLPASLPVWEHIPLMHYFQFPWRFLSLMILVCAFVSGSILSLRSSKITAGVLIAIAVVASYAYTQPAYYMMRNDAYYVTRSNFIDSTNSPGNSFNTIWNISKSQRPTQLFLSQNSAIISEIKKLSPTEFSAKSSALSPTKQILNVSYFPGWEVIIDNKTTGTSPQKGLLSFKLQQGTHMIHIVLTQTLGEIVATWITILSFTVLFLVFLLRKKMSTLMV